MRMLRLLLAGITARGDRARGMPVLLLQLLLTRGLRRSPMGFIATLLLEKALRGDGRLWGMDLASRRKARMAWLAGFLGQRRTSIR
jgi:hypothetical protein